MVQHLQPQCFDADPGLDARRDALDEGGVEAGPRQARTSDWQWSVACGDGHGPCRRAAIQALSAPGRQVRRALATDGDASWLPSGREEFRGEHADECGGRAGTLSSAVPGAGPPVEPPGLLELVRYQVGPCLRRGRVDHASDRSGVHPLRRRQGQDRHRGAVSGSEHGGAARHALSGALQGRDDALRHPARHGPFVAVSGRRDVRAAVHEAASCGPWNDRCCVATPVGHSRRLGRCRSVSQWTRCSADSGRMRQALRRGPAGM